MPVIHLCGRAFKPRTQCQILIAAIVLLFLIIAVPTVSILNANYSTVKRSDYSTGKVDPLNREGFDGVIVWANITAIDTVGFTVRSRFSFHPIGSYATELVPGLNVFKERVEFTTQRKKTRFDSDEILPSADNTYPIILGDPNRYPFDEYQSEFVFNLRKGEESVPVAFGMVGAVQGWNIYITITDLPDNNIRVSVSASRGWIIKFFSSFVLVIMWVLSLTILTLSSTIWFRERKVEPPIISLCASLMFALPAIRNTQPGAPIIGCTADVGGFFWNMALVSFAAFLAMLNYIVMYKRVKPTPPAPPPTASPADQKPPSYMDKDRPDIGPIDEKDQLIPKV